MADGGTFFETHPDGGGTVLTARGRWQVDNATALDRALSSIGNAPRGTLRFDLAGIDAMDTVGAFLLLQKARSLDAKLDNVPQGFGTLGDLLKKRGR